MQDGKPTLMSLPATIREHIQARWRDDIVARLTDYIRIPAKSPSFDPDWAAHGHLDRVVAEARSWALAQRIAALSIEIVTLPGRTPCLFFDVPARGAGNDRTVLFYGHLDKQPEMSGWRPGLGPWQPVLENGRLYGRGASDDGYAIYAALTAIGALDAAGAPRPRCVGLIETCEESGSFDLPAYLDALAPRMGQVGLLIALDSGCGDYERLWMTSSLRGMVGGLLTVDVLDEGVHSGSASGIVPSSFRIVRMLLDRLEDARTGELLDGAFVAEVPPDRQRQAQAAGQVVGERAWSEFPLVHRPGGGAMSPMTRDPAQAILNRTWRPTLSVIGAEGLPLPNEAGNVLRPSTALKLSVRLPPTVDCGRASERLKALMESDPPYGARVRFEPDWAASGWNAPATAPWLEDALGQASRAAFGQDPVWMGEGGTIPFIAMLGRKFPQVQFIITGVLGPQSNAHGPNEFLDIAYATRLTQAVAQVVALARL
jgi:acetylornithine deacetylase/succinyl-diaminopimelate desuccinylase-like protein